MWHLLPSARRRSRPASLAECAHLQSAEFNLLYYTHPPNSGQSSFAGGRVCCPRDLWSKLLCRHPEQHVRDGDHEPERSAHTRRGNWRPKVGMHGYLLVCYQAGPLGRLISETRTPHNTVPASPPPRAAAEHGADAIRDHLLDRCPGRRLLLGARVFGPLHFFVVRCPVFAPLLCTVR